MRGNKQQSLRVYGKYLIIYIKHNVVVFPFPFQCFQKTILFRRDFGLQNVQLLTGKQYSNVQMINIFFFIIWDNTRFPSI